jgi:PadR family transcriptional regulator PadR
MNRPKTELLKGTLDLLVLNTLASGSAHGYGIARWIEDTTHDALQIEEGSLYPALYRMEDRGWIASEWGVTEKNRRAKFYRLTARGRKQLEEETSSWERIVEAVGLVLETRKA